MRVLSHSLGQLGGDTHLRGPSTRPVSHLLVAARHVHVVEVQLFQGRILGYLRYLRRNPFDVQANGMSLCPRSSPNALRRPSKPSNQTVQSMFHLKIAAKPIQILGLPTFRCALCTIQIILRPSNPYLPATLGVQSPANCSFRVKDVVKTMRFPGSLAPPPVSEGLLLKKFQ